MIGQQLVENNSLWIPFSMSKSFTRYLLARTKFTISLFSIAKDTSTQYVLANTFSCLTVITNSAAFVASVFMALTEVEVVNGGRSSSADDSSSEESTTVITTGTL